MQSQHSVSLSGDGNRKDWRANSLDSFCGRSIDCGPVEQTVSRENSSLSDDNRIIQGLWIGNTLSTMEKLSIASFLRHGHIYHLYSYNQLADVPTGAVVKDAREVLPESAIFQYRDRPSYAGFANFFR